MIFKSAPIHRSFGFSADQRLKKPSDFKRVYQSKQWGSSEHFTFNVLANEKERFSLGVTVSKKVSKSAVVRNRIKRQIKEFYRLRQHEITGASLVITAKANCAQASDQQRQTSLEVLWNKIRKWQKWHIRQHPTASER